MWRPFTFPVQLNYFNSFLSHVYGTSINVLLDVTKSCSLFRVQELPAIADEGFILPQRHYECLALTRLILNISTFIYRIINVNLILWNTQTVFLLLTSSNYILYFHLFFIIMHLVQNIILFCLLCKLYIKPRFTGELR